MFDLLGLLSGGLGGAGAPMQILPQIHQDAIAPSLMDGLKGAASANSGELMKYAGGLLSPQQKPLPMMKLPQHQQMPLGMAGPSAGGTSSLLARLR